MILRGKCSSFGGPSDKTMVNDTGLAFYESQEADKREDLFLAGDHQIPTWQRLKADTAYYIALNIPIGADRKWAQESRWVITNPKTERFAVASLVDRGPGAPGRVCDLSPALLQALELETDDVVIVEEML